MLWFFLQRLRIKFGLCRHTSKPNFHVSGVLVPSLTTSRLIFTLVPLVEYSCSHPSGGFPAQFWFNRLINDKVMLLYFFDDFVTVLFCIALAQSICFRSFNSFGSIGYFREHSPAIFLRPQNIIKHALYGILALYSLNPNLNPNQNRTHVPRYLLVLNLVDLRALAPY